MTNLRVVLGIFNASLGVFPLLVRQDIAALRGEQPVSRGQGLRGEQLLQRADGYGVFLSHHGGA